MQNCCLMGTDSVLQDRKGSINWLHNNTNVLGLLWRLSGKESACSEGAAGDLASILVSGRSPGGGHGNPLLVLAWRIPWTEEPGGQQPMGSQRVRHDWSHSRHAHILSQIYNKLFKRERSNLKSPNTYPNHTLQHGALRPSKMTRWKAEKTHSAPSDFTTEKWSQSLQGTASEEFQEF